MARLAIVTLALCACGAAAFGTGPSFPDIDHNMLDWSCMGAIGDTVCTGKIISNAKPYGLENYGSADLYYDHELSTVWEVKVESYGTGGVCEYSIKAQGTSTDYFGIDPHVGQDECNNNMFTGDRNQEDEYTLAWHIDTTGYIAHSDMGNWVFFTATQCDADACKYDGGFSCPKTKETWGFRAEPGYDCDLPGPLMP